MKIQIRKSSIHGDGVFATDRISCGDVILPVDDSRIVDSQHPVREDLGEDPEHCDYLPDGTTVLMQGPAGYFNHSCSPNVFTYSADSKRFILAMRDIAQGEELLFDYSINAIEGDVWACRCGAAGCRSRHKCDFFALPRHKQLEYLQFLDPWFAEVHQERILMLLNATAPGTGVASR